MNTTSKQPLASWLWEQIKLGVLCGLASGAIMTITLFLFGAIRK